jgi:hypothetical protein
MKTNNFPALTALLSVAFLVPVTAIAAVLPEQGVWFEYWELPLQGIEQNPPTQNITVLPDYSAEPYRTHKLIGKRINNFNLSAILRSDNFGCRYTGQIQINSAGTYTFYTTSDDGSKLWIDGTLIVNNDGLHGAQERSGAVSLATGRHTIQVDFFEKTGGQVLEVRYAGPGIAKQLIPDSVLFRPPTPAGEAEVQSLGTILRDVTLSYNYGTSFMYDETDGLYKCWFCASGDIPGGILGDNIGFRASSTIDGMLNGEFINALPPANNASKFDDVHACDPNVYRVGNSYYLTYSGNTRNTTLPERTRIGMAVSTDGGRHFSRLNGGNHIIEPDPTTYAGGYGDGQSAIVRANDGYFYMIYTHAPGGTGDTFPVVRTANPTFAPGSFSTVATLDGSQTGGYSVDMVYDAVNEWFIVVANTTPAGAFAVTPTTSRVRLTYFNKNWTQLFQREFVFTVGFGFGEGVGLLRNSEGRVLRPVIDGVRCLVFTGATSESTTFCTLWAPWVEGDLKYVVVADPDGPIESGRYRVANVNSGKVADVEGLSVADGANIQQWDYLGGANQVWDVQYLGDSQYRLVAAHSGKVMDVAGISTADGANIHQWGWGNGNNQRWRIESAGNGEYRLVSVHSGKVLEVANSSTSNGGNIQQWTWTGAANQRWRFQNHDWPVNSTVASSAIWPSDSVKDGNYWSAWSSVNRGSAASTESISYWFDTFHPINYVRLRPRLNGDWTRVLAFPLDFTIYYSNGASWVKVKECVSFPAPDAANWAVIPLGATVNANGIQIVATKLTTDGGANYYFQLAEARAGNDAQLTAQDWTVNGVAVSSEFSAGWPAANLKDNNAGSFWSSRGNASANSTEWIAYWLDTYHPVNYLKFWPRYGSTSAIAFPVNFTVYYSDGVNWQFVQSYTSYATPTLNDWVTIFLPDTLSANGIHVVATTLSTDGGSGYLFQLGEAKAGYYERLR